MLEYMKKEYFVKRLLKEYEKYNDLIIGCDFDNTLFDLYEEGYDYEDVIALMIRCQDMGLTTCLWTACTDTWSLTYKKALCIGMGLKFDRFNESIALNDSRKPHFSILLDDRAGLASSYEILCEVLDGIEEIIESKSL